MEPSPRQPLQPSRTPNLLAPSSTPSAMPGALPSSSSAKPKTPPPTTSTKPNAPPPTPPTPPHTSSTKPVAPGPTSSTKPNTPPPPSSTHPNTPPFTPPTFSNEPNTLLPSQAQSSPSAGSLGFDPNTSARVKQSDLVYEQVLRHLDWDGKYPDLPPKPFKAFYFLQPASPQQHFQAPGLGTPATAHYWDEKGSLVTATAVMIPSEAQSNDLEAWAKRQGKEGRLCPDVFLVGEQRVVGHVLDVD